MTLPYSSSLVNEALRLRKNGYSYEEISKKLKIAKSSAYLWCNQVVLNEKAKKRISGRMAIGIKKAKEVLKTKKDNIMKIISDNSNNYVSKIESNKEFNKLLCSFLYWGEGSKNTNSLIFTNSNPKMIRSYLNLLRESFELDESKFRALVHVHEYHEDIEIKKYWSKITNIPLSQFSKSYLKPHTSKNIREGYKGTISIRYYNYKIALELSFIYNRFADKLIK
ncbi:hypothetical protein COS77_02310 [Candidatus Roizmanbacteria bacterium CG06_land_8_20_14_3_00_34_14]|uniref:Resolvase HTH domain-containing protein n=2 Tax=Candidatus Roizmaniibacteriota TaxID=1752723 RepID=A0A2M7AUM1_9BACT|nr:MAG: hypothetical protein COT02_02490 [Candidatus Roizmanbacteria bacterium CG07_land_8_20_14_0_80_34_15]PIU74289.1 MAG: hypothetical protein COS77_02310 [Candidatus Roizmanbacteria bacterium CG06_land_8_20_14_3_00_34_14]